VLYAGQVRIWLDLPDDVVEQLHAEGQDLSRAALEALAIDAYRMNPITAHQLCRVLGIPSRYALDGFGRCLARCREQRRGTRGTGDGQIRRQPKMPQDPADDGAVLDERDEAQAAATARAR
jgi:hypothetical protein